MQSKSITRRLQESARYPKAVCEGCSTKAGGNQLPVDGSSWSAVCDICWEFTVVNNPVFLGCPVFQLDKKQLDRLKDQG